MRKFVVKIKMSTLKSVFNIFEETLLEKVRFKIKSILILFSDPTLLLGNLYYKFFIYNSV